MKEKASIEDVVSTIEVILDRREEYAGQGLNDIDGSTSLTDDLGFDSMELADLTVLLEDKYGVDVFNEEIVDSVGEVIDKINENNT